LVHASILGSCGWAAGTGRAALSAAEELKVLEDNLEFAALLLGGFIFPLIEAEPALNEEGAAFGAILGDQLALFAPSFDVYKGGLFAGLARLVLEGTRYCQTELAYSRALGRDSQFGVTGEVSDQEDAVEVGHGGRVGV
jgi:hypothetical protein